ncbi:hypothetical protein [Kitasatospora phosalacinea]|uniref:pPIWI-RE three-gene island domain-containing protein n=1 Tax=Kitasatospora phosalacinea TaxID=2065 RepID=A0ABW6GU96_9ACTN
MRSTTESLAGLINELVPGAGELKRPRLQFLCEVELGLYVQECFVPGAPAVEAWPLFSGYPFARAWGAVGPAEEQTLRTARHTTWIWARRTAWTEALADYQRLDRHLRAYEVTDPERPAVRRSSLPLAPERWEVYDRLLRFAPVFAGQPMNPAGPGRHAFPIGRQLASVRLPKVILPPPEGHDLALLPTNGGEPLSFDWAELLDTAASMNARKFEDWVGRLASIRLFTHQDGRFRRSDRLDVARLQHLLGIVGVGKSTLRDVLAIHVASRGLRVTVVVGDVAEQLKLVERYNTYLPASAVPVIGASSRQQHAEQLHRRLTARGRRNVLTHDDAGFDHLSTSCAINALLHDEGQFVDEPLDFGEAPCTRLQPPQRRRNALDDAWGREKLSCPFWSGCPRHHTARELVGATVWVATMASLVDSSVPHPQNPERIRYLELACRRSDLVVVDEADRVQMDLDRMFAPAVPLIAGRSDSRSFLYDVNQHRLRELAGTGQIQLSNRDVENWSAAVNTIQTAADRLVAMLVRDVNLRTWVRTGYFSAWTLQLRLVEERYPFPEDQDTVGPEQAEDPHWEARRQIQEVLDAFRDNVFGDRRPPTPEGARLTRLLNELLHTTYRENTRGRVKEVLCDLFDLHPLLEPTETGRRHYRQMLERANVRPDRSGRSTRGKAGRGSPRRKGTLPEEPEDWLELLLPRFEFALLLSALEPRLALVNAMWPRVATALNLGFNEMYRRPPDYGPMVPEAPMGNVIGFQFLMDGPDLGGVRSGELRFFRCSGVGRELLRAMPDLPTVDGRPGTNVLLMSGSSWAGRSSRYHLQVPVGAIIEPERRKLDRIAELSEFRFEFVREGCECRSFCGCESANEAIRLSGEPLDRRNDVLRRMVTVLGRNDHGPSRLQDELALLPENRRHILLLVGSYEEAAVVADALHTLNTRWKDRVYRLVPDDDPDAGLRTEADENHAPTLRRGDVEMLAFSRAQILVAPLLAVERGHNILDTEKQYAAIGSVYFLARPNPRPEDLNLAVHTINDWIVRAVESGEFDDWVRRGSSLGRGARTVRDLARSEWFTVLSRSLAWSRLGDRDRRQITWDLLVLVWQVIGRSVRGGGATRVAFVDAAFAPRLAAGGPSDEPDDARTSLLYSIHTALSPYFTPGGAVPAVDRHIVRTLYRPMWSALDRCLNTLETERNLACTS